MRSLEEMAHEIAKRLKCADEINSIGVDRWHAEKSILQALQEVRREENEACAKVIENFECQEHEDKDLCEHYCESKKVFIRQIRARMSQAESQS